MYKKALFSFIFLLMSMSLAGQTLRGEVYDSETKLAVPGASVYYSNTQIGTITDSLGRFFIRALPGRDITVSCVGYSSLTLRSDSTSSLISIRLNPRQHQLNEVLIGYDGMKDDEKFELFRREFIGTSEFAQSCKILNPKDLTLSYHKDTKTLDVYSDKPILIENVGLGYRITYFLKAFTRSPVNTAFSGNMLFEEMPKEQKFKKIIANRERTYAGSRMQFIRALWHNTLAMSGFEIYSHDGKRIDKNELLSTGANNEKFLKVKENVTVRYSDGYTIRLSHIGTNNVPCFVGRDGFSNTGIKWSGDMTRQRVGDLLPFDFKSKTEHYEDTALAVATILIPPIRSTTQTAADEVIDEYQNTFEKVYLHTDKDRYKRGEDLWFKAYLVNPANNHLLNSSNNLYVDLISPHNILISKEIIRLDNGTGNGDFHLAENFIAGTYKIRAYTKWTAGFGSDLIFEKTINVAADSLDEAYNFEEMPISKSVAEHTAEVKLNDLGQPELKVRFFPEGGHMIDGLESNVAIKAEDKLGTPLIISGIVTLDKQSPIAKFSTDSAGMGHFKITPTDTGKYEVLASYGKKTYNFRLPVVLKYGAVMTVDNGPNKLGIEIFSKSSNVQPIADEADYMLVFKHAGTIVKKEKINLTSGHSNYIVDKSKFTEGIVCITLLDPHARPVSERLIYIEPTPGSDIEISTIAGSETLQGVIKLKMNGRSEAPASLSLAAVEALQDDHSEQQDIRSNLLLTSDIKGHIDKPMRYFDRLNKDRAHDLDLLLMTQGWRSYVWQDVEDSLHKTANVFEHGIKLTGRVTSVFGEKPLSGMTVTMVIGKTPGKGIYSVKTGLDGKFSIDSVIFYGYQFINFTSRNINKIGLDGNSIGHSGGWIKIDSVNTLNPPISDAIPIYRRRVENASKKNAQSNATPVTKKLLAPVNIHDARSNAPEIHQISPADIHDYQSLMEYLLHIIPGTHEEQGGCHIYPSNTPTDQMAVLAAGRFPSTKVWIFGDYVDKGYIDYQSICDQDYLSQPMSNILKVTIKRSYKSKTPLIMIWIVLRPGSLNRHDFFDNASANVNGYYSARKFFLPTSNSSIEHNQMGTTVLWEPNLKTDENGVATITLPRYFSNKAKIRMHVEGISANGTVVSTTHYYIANHDAK